jgi:hypothetical protein
VFWTVFNGNEAVANAIGHKLKNTKDNWQSKREDKLPLTDIVIP